MCYNSTLSISNIANFKSASRSLVYGTNNSTLRKVSNTIAVAIYVVDCVLNNNKRTISHNAHLKNKHNHYTLSINIFAHIKLMIIS